jgi:2-haloacid dehalogenase
VEKPQAVVFDVFGTLVDWHSSIAAHAVGVGDRAGVELDGGRLATLWREQYAPSLATVISGQRPWGTFDELHRDSLPGVLDTLGVTLDERSREQLVSGWRRLAPWPEVPRALARLRERLPVATLSNGQVRLLVDLSRSAGLSFDAVLSAELFGTYKPDRAVYLGAARLLECAPERVMLIACHGWDLSGAREAGLSTGHVARPWEWGSDSTPAETPEADLTGGDLDELVDRLVAVLDGS